MARWLDQIARVYQAFKAAPPAPGALYPPARSSGGGGPISWEGWPDRGGTGRGLGDARSQGRQDLENVRRAIQSPWVFRDVNAIANEASAAALMVRRRDGEGLEDITNHPFEVRWAAPNEHMGRSFVVRFWAFSMMLTGRAYLYLRPVGGALAEIWPVPPWAISPIPDPNDFISGYRYDLGPDKTPLTIDRRYIVYSRLPNLFDLRDGMSPLVAGNMDIAGDLAASRWNANFFSKDNAAPTGMVTVPRDTLDSDLERIRLEIRDFFADGQRRVAVGRAGDLDWKPFDRSQKDMEFSAGRAFTEGLVDTLFGLPKGYWSDKANRANAEAARLVMIENTVWPLLVGLAEDLNAQAGPAWLAPDEVIGFSDIRPTNYEREAAEFSAYGPVMTINELRRLRKLAPLPDWRGLALLEEIKKGAPLPGTVPAMAAEDAAAEMGGPGGVAPEVAEEPSEDDAADEVLMEDTNADDAAAEELKRWERKALKALRAGRGAAVRFESAAIPDADAARITDALKAAATPDAVRAAFKAEASISDVWADAVRWARVAMDGADDAE